MKGKNNPYHNSLILKEKSRVAFHLQNGKHVTK